MPVLRHSAYEVCPENKKKYFTFNVVTTFCPLQSTLPVTQYTFSTSASTVEMFLKILSFVVFYLPCCFCSPRPEKIAGWQIRRIRDNVDISINSLAWSDELLMDNAPKIEEKSALS